MILNCKLSIVIKSHGSSHQTVICGSISISIKVLSFVQELSSHENEEKEHEHDTNSNKNHVRSDPLLPLQWGNGQCIRKAFELKLSSFSDESADRED